MSYLWHVTLDSGHRVQSPRVDAGSEGVTAAAVDLTAALAAGEAGIAWMPGYTLAATKVGAALLCRASGTVGTLVTFGIASRPRGAGRLWSMLLDGRAYPVASEPPDAPWCAVRLEADALRDPGAMAWLAEYERLVAWAWVEGRAKDVRP